MTLPFWVLKALVFGFWAIVLLAWMLVARRSIVERRARRREERRPGYLSEELIRKVRQ